MAGRVFVIVPSRGRSARLADMLDAVLGLSDGRSDVAVCTDDDDPDAAGYDALRGLVPPGRVMWFSGRRRSMHAWTNYVAAGERAAPYSYLASLGDDHLPRTVGWDAELTAVIEAGGGTGIAYGNDLHQGERLPTAPVISRNIPGILGWMILPSMSSKYADNVWKTLGERAGCLHYVPGVVIEHVHPDAGKAALDDTYLQGNASWDADRGAYLHWERTGAAVDAVLVKMAMAAERKETWT